MLWPSYGTVSGVTPGVTRVPSDSVTVAGITAHLPG